MNNVHRPVLLKEVLTYLNLKENGYYLDGTVGAGGHTIGMLQTTSGNINVLGIDRDSEILKIAEENIRRSGYENKVILRHCNFSDSLKILDELKWEKLDGVILDLGISSYQVDSPDRGFSFHENGPLDMRMDRSHGISASDLVNTLGYEDLKNIIKLYGEEPLAPKIAKKIVEKRKHSPIKTTKELSDIVLEAYPAKWRRTAKRHPATRTFQALRIAVNEELKELEDFLMGILDRLAQGARIVIISFHSLEDRIVKHFFKRESKDCICPPGQMVCICGHKKRVKIITKKPIVPSEEEIEENKRARSAKMRVAEVL